MIRKNKLLKKKIQFLLYQNKWILLVFYFGLVIGLGLYAIKFLIVLFDIVIHFWSDTENDMLIGMLTLVDLAMIANLIKMVITGSYQSFVDKVPENTEKVSSGLLKVKMSTSLIGVTAIHLLKDFVESSNVAHKDIQYWYNLSVKVGIHVIFIISSWVLAKIDLMHSDSELIEEKSEHIKLKNEILIHQIKHHRINRPIVSKLPTDSSSIQKSPRISH